MLGLLCLSQITGSSQVLHGDDLLRGSRRALEHMANPAKRFLALGSSAWLSIFNLLSSFREFRVYDRA